MTSYTLSPVWGAGAQLFDNSGNVLTGGKIETYEAGTTTPAATYTDPIGNVFNSNPIVADASGRLSNEIWLSVGKSYKFILKDANNVLIATYDNIPTIPQPPIVNDASSISYEQGYTVTAGAFTVGATYRITSVGTTNFVAIGAAANATGILFTATGVGSGNGTAEYSRTVQTKLRETVSVKDFGAVGDGVADDTAAINAAFTYAATANCYVTLPAGTYNISSPITITNGVKGFIGQGGTIFATSATGYIVLVGIYGGQASNVSNCKIENINFNANSLATNGFLCQNINNSVIENNYLYNLPFSNANGIVLRTFKTGLANTYNNIVCNNIISGAIASPGDAGGAGIGIDVLNADLNYGVTGTTDPTAYWKATFTAADATYKGVANIVANNSVTGAYYGISLSAASYNTVTGNNVQSNVRGISVQNCCAGNEITGNTIFENESSGIHLACGSSNNNIDANTVYSTRAVGEGQLQAYVGCQANKFSNNKVTMTGSSYPQYMIYCAVMSGGNEFKNNTIGGAAYKAMIGVESTWNTATTNPASRAYNNPAVGSGWANTGMTLVSMVGNTIGSSDATSPAIFFYQVTQGTVCGLSNCNIESNRITNANQNYQLELAEDTSGNLVNFILLTNNFYYDQVLPSNFILARGRACLAKCMGNVMFNDLSLGYQFPDGTATPSVASLDIVSTAAYTTPTTITNFPDGMQGQVILVRLSVNTTIQNNASILLNGGVNIVGSSSNQFVTLFNKGASVWVELTRNF